MRTIDAASLVVSVLACCGALAIHAQTNGFRIHSGTEEVPGAEFVAAINLSAHNSKAVGTVFLSDTVPRVRTVIVLLEHGPRGPLSAQGRFGDSEWRRATAACECALLYMRFDTIRALTDTSVQKDPLRNAELGGADALLALLQRLSVETQHAELATAPVLLWGWSSAATFGMTFAQMHPARTVGFIQYHTNLRGIVPDMAQLQRVPALLIAGGKDTTRVRMIWSRS